MSSHPTYFKAIKAARMLREFRQLAENYWSETPELPSGPGWQRGVLRAEALRDTPLRARLNRVYPPLSALLDELGVQHNDLWFLPLVVDQEYPGGCMPRQKIRDALERCAGQVESLQTRFRWEQLLNPVWWLREGCAMIVRFPVTVFRAAGMPEKFEHQVWAYVVMVVWGAALFGLALLLGIRLTARDLLHMWLSK